MKGEITMSLLEHILGVLFLLFFIVLVLTGLISYSCCWTSGRISRQEEKRKYNNTFDMK